MNKKCIVSVAVGEPYSDWQRTLLNSLRNAHEGANIMFWNKNYPPGSPTHFCDPYAFKYWALEHAYKCGCEQVLWMDASSYLKSSLDSVWIELDNSAIFLVPTTMNFGNWCSDAALNIMDINRDNIFHKPLIAGSLFGINFKMPEGMRYFREFERYTKAGVLKGAHVNSICSNVNLTDHDKNSVGYVSSNHSVYGHSHDEAVLTGIQINSGIEINHSFKLLFDNNDSFSYILNEQLNEICLELQGMRNRSDRIRTTV